MKKNERMDVILKERELKGYKEETDGKLNTIGFQLKEVIYILI